MEQIETEPRIITFILKLYEYEKRMPLKPMKALICVLLSAKLLIVDCNEESLNELLKLWQQSSHNDARIRSINRETKSSKASSLSPQRLQTFILLLKDNCNHYCHEKISLGIKKERYTPISHRLSQLSTTSIHMKQIESYVDELKYYVPMPTSFKIHKDISNRMSNNCIKEISLSVSFVSMSEKELLDFQESLASFPVLRKLDARGLQPELQGSLIVSDVTCEDLSLVVKTLAALPEVLWVEELQKVVPFNRWAKGICQTGNVNAVPLYSTGNITGSTQIIGIADTGIDMFSCYFHDPNVPPPFDKVDFKHRKVILYNSTFGDKIDYDGSEAHGTHVSGTAAGRSYQDWGDYRQYNGIAYGSKIAFLDIGKPVQGGNGIISIGDLYNRLFLPQYKIGARIFSNSWGSPVEKGDYSGNRYDNQAQAVDKFMWDFPDALVFFAAGNSGMDGPNTVGTPAVNKNGIAVGASLSDALSWKSYARYGSGTSKSATSVEQFSSEGPTADGRLKPDILAPGVFITSATGLASASQPHCDVQGIGGTSQATPVAAGSAVLVRQYFLSGHYLSGGKTSSVGFNPSGALVKAVLLHSGQRINEIAHVSTVASAPSTSSPYTGKYPSNVIGYGRIQLNTVLNFGSSKRTPVTLFVVGAAHRNSSLYAAVTSKTGVNYTFYTSARPKTIRITMVYTDFYPANGAYKSPLVNDLDLVVFYRTASGVCQFTYPLPDNRNSPNDTVEMVELSHPVPNTNYTVWIRGRKLVQVPQPFALVVTGDVTFVNDTYDPVILLNDAVWARGTAPVLSWLIAFLAVGLGLSCMTIFWIFRSNKTLDLLKSEMDEDELKDLEGVENIKTN